MNRSVCFFVLALGLLTGCGEKANKPIATPTFDASAMAQAALSDYDTDKNGQLSVEELNACPGLKKAFPKGGAKIEDLRPRFEGYKSAGAETVMLTFTLGGKPLSGANITLVPEACMKGAIAEATGTTDANGIVGSFTCKGETFPGLALGLYKVKVTGAGVPAKYNDQTTLGLEVGGSARGTGGAIKFDLSAK
jgi:hypothetical protein